MTDLKHWIKCASVRAIKTIAQTAVSLITVGATMSEVDWLFIGSTSLLSGIVSVLTSIATGLPECSMEKEVEGVEE